MKMRASYIKNIVLLVLCAISSVYCGNTLQFSDSRAPGPFCPDMSRCNSYNSHLSHKDTSCKCDNMCNFYGDCCFDAPSRARNNIKSSNSFPRRQLPFSRSDVTCLNYGVGRHTGVYAINKCDSAWNGPKEVREKCVGLVDYRDPIKAAPVTDAAQSITYRNIYCAECNNANVQLFTIFQLRLAFKHLPGLTKEQIFGDLTYNAQTDHWGVYRINKYGNATIFIPYDISFVVPRYLHNSVRFCKSNVISKCAQNWYHLGTKQKCNEYTAVVYDDNNAYKNPHCALCNFKSANKISCRTEYLSRKRPMSFALLLDVNQSDGDQVGMRRVATPSCQSGYKYDPFFKKCRELVCALPDHVVRNRKCVRK